MGYGTLKLIAAALALMTLGMRADGAHAKPASTVATAICPISTIDDAKAEALRAAITTALGGQQMPKLNGIVVAKTGAGFTRFDPMMSVFGPGQAPNTKRALSTLSVPLSFHVLERAQKAGIFSWDDPVRLPYWQGADPRTVLTFRHLIDMKPGQIWNERFGELSRASDWSTALFGPGRLDPIAAFASKPAKGSPGQKTILCRFCFNVAFAALQQRLPPKTKADVRRTFALQALIWPEGSEVEFGLDFDRKGHFYASSGMHLSGRDLVKQYQTLLSADSRCPPAMLDRLERDYQLSTRLKQDGQAFGFERNELFPDVGAALFYARGEDGQMVIVLPEKGVIIAVFATGARGNARHVKAAWAELAKTLSPVVVAASTL